METAALHQCILPALLYGCEDWGLPRAAKNKLAVAQRRMQKSVDWLIDKRSNAWLRGITKVKDVTEAARRRKWSCVEYGYRQRRQLAHMHRRMAPTDNKTPRNASDKME
ncbi:hypothetical protein L596_022281 [Steinernema carpocapsae]|uniref:Uncharacterized protein n=1 Tax=Steinernema carpocapsae TaxID=34508 RepID=A0A4U5MLM5_STECR|nr:hypothetical protein L596_022281 [Steinernema carpocapsae]